MQSTAIMEMREKWRTYTSGLKRMPEEHVEHADNITWIGFTPEDEDEDEDALDDADIDADVNLEVLGMDCMVRPTMMPIYSAAKSVCGSPIHCWHTAASARYPVTPETEDGKRCRIRARTAIVALVAADVTWAKRDSIRDRGTGSFVTHDGYPSPTVAPPAEPPPGPHLRRCLLKSPRSATVDDVAIDVGSDVDGESRLAT